jgi:hypothetical protein
MKRRAFLKRSLAAVLGLCAAPVAPVITWVCNSQTWQVPRRWIFGHPSAKSIEELIVQQYAEMHMEHLDKKILAEYDQLS